MSEIPGEPCDEAAFGLARIVSWSEEDRAVLLDSVDESDYSLDDWIEALGAFEGWLEERGEERRPFRQIVGYIDCCTLMTSPGVSLGNLKVIVYQALTDFGFAFIDDAQV